MNRIQLYSVAYFLLVLTFIIEASDAQPNLVSSDGIKWTQISDINEKYKNWTIFERDVKKYHQVYVSILNLTNCHKGFEWKVSNVDDYNKIDLIINENTYDSCKSDSFVPTSFKVNPGDEFKLMLWPMSSEDIRIYIAFPPTAASKIENVSPNRPPSTPVILSPGPSERYNERYNESLYFFSVRSSDPDGDRIAYTFKWGDGNISQTELLRSGEVHIQNHSWSRAGFYNITVVATDEQSANSSFSEAFGIQINWLVKVPQETTLQPIIDNILSNTTILLEGSSYEGPINIEKVSWINLSSNLTKSNITSSIIDHQYVIGLENVNNIIINRINISTDLNGVYLNNSSYCMILNNTIYSVMRGIHILGGHDNKIINNNITMTEDDLRPFPGLSLEDTWNNTVNCNIIFNKKNNSPLYYIRNSTFDNNEINAIIPDVHNCIIQYGSSKYAILNGDECCCNLTQNNELDCMKCIYKSEGDKMSDEDCSLPFRLVSCA